MNILPKKRWHVRTKDNIARVRRDEKEAEAKEKQRLEKLKFAESEARINFLRRQSGQPERESNPTEIEESTAASSQHIDLFADYKTHIKTTNKDLEKEQKDEREKYEKQIGYLTYLGQDTNEALKLRSWYEIAPKRSKHIATNKTEEEDFKNKYTQDPLTLINTLLPSGEKAKEPSISTSKDTKIISYAESQASSSKEQCPTNRIHKTKIKKDKKSKSKKEKKSKKHKHNKSDKKDKKDAKHKNNRKDITTEHEQKKRELLERLRKERLKREATERARQDKLLEPPKTEEPEEIKKQNPAPQRIVQKYNSQFNPELAKQNML